MAPTVNNYVYDGISSVTAVISTKLVTQFSWMSVRKELNLIYRLRVT